MSQEHAHLSHQLTQVIHKMQKVQSRISGSQQPASMHEIDELKRLGTEYSVVIEQLAHLDSSNKIQNS